MSWIDINEERPIWYNNVDLKVNGEIRENWHRLSADGETVYYGTNHSDEVIFEDEVTHWRNHEL